MRERKQGRPPSYPSVVTTTTTTENIHGNAGTSSGGGPDYTFNGNFSAGTGVVHLSTAASASSDVSTGGGTDIEKPVMSLESALGIYQRRKDAETCLKEYRRAYDHHDCRNIGHDSIEGVDDNGSGENTREKNVEAGATSGPLSRRHNEAVLAHLSMLRSRRRRRPSSFDVTSSDNLSFDKSKGETNEKSSEKSDASNDDMARLLSTMLNISYAGSSVGGIDTANVAPLDSEFRTSNASSDTSKSRERKKEKKKNDGDIPESPPSKLSRYNRLVATYNLCLTRFASGKYAEALCDEISVPLLQEMNLLARLGDEEGIDGDDDHSATVQSAGMPDIYDLDEKNHHFLRNLAITTRLGFLVLDCILARLCGNGVGLSLVPIRWDDPSVETNDGLNDDEVKCLENGVIMSNISANSILSWIEKNSLPVAMSDRNSVFLSQYDLGYHELKFNLHLYRSRVLFVRDSEIVDDPADSGVSQSGSGSDGNGDLAARARISRKELKSAMDIFQNKLLIEEEMKDQYDIHADCRGRGDGSRNNSSKVGKLATEGNRGRKNSISSHRRNNSNGKYHTQDGSETTSVTSMAGGSFVTSLSDALWSDGKGVAVPRATFEGMPNKLSNAQNTHSEQMQGQLSSMLTSSNVSATKKKSDNPDLEARHELALFLKGNLEYLRGNATKSLKLCIEARLAGKKSLLGGRDEQNRRDRAEIAKNNDGLSESMPNGINDYSRHQLDANTRLEKLMMNEYDLAIYYNNLALVHQAEGKVHIALHYYSLALSSMERVHNLDEKKSTQLRISNNTNFWSDGIARPDFSAEMLNNASICAFQANDFKIAYECMARCIMISPDVFGKRARCWLRMGQSFIGIHALSPQKDSAAKRRDNSEGYFVSTTTTFDELAQLVGENEIETGFRNDGDLTVAFENPLRRASFCLQRAMRLSNPNINARTGKEDETLPMHCSDIHCFETSVLSLAYINLELDHPYEVIELCRLLIESNVDRPQFSDDKLVNRNRAIAKVYSCEALCRTANSQGALAAIIGDNHDIDGAVEVLTEEIVKDAGGGGAVEAQYIAHSTVAGSLACAGDAHNAAHCASLISGNVDPGGVLEDGYPEDSFLERRVRLFSLLNGSDGKGKNDDTIGE